LDAQEKKNIEALNAFCERLDLFFFLQVSSACEFFPKGHHPFENNRFGTALSLSSHLRRSESGENGFL
jgi:hypothetical protein